MHYFQLLSALFIFSLMASPTIAAEYNGANIDGTRYDATVYSYDTGKYYYVQLEFDGDEATIYFSNEGHISVTLDDEEIDDPQNISAYDYQRGIYWDLDVEGLD